MSDLGQAERYSQLVTNDHNITFPKHANSNTLRVPFMFSTNGKPYLDQFKTDIMSVLENEIIKRYFYREGMYAYILSSNTEIFKAQDIINDVRAYQNILK